MVLACHAVAHGAQTNGAGHALQFTVTVGSTGQAIERVIGDIQLHHVAAQIRELRRLRTYLHARLGRRRARRRKAASPFNLNQAESAGAKGLQRVGGTELRDHRARFDGCPHQGSAFLDGDSDPVDFELDVFAGG